MPEADDSALIARVAEIADKYLEKQRELPFATKEEILLPRDKKGERLPFEALTPNEGLKIRFLPLNLGEHLQLKSRGKPFADWSLEDKCSILNSNLLEPDLGVITPDDLLSAFDWVSADDIVACIYDNSRASRRKMVNIVSEEEREKGGMKGSPSNSPIESSSDISTNEDTGSPGETTSTESSS